MDTPEHHAEQSRQMPQGFPSGRMLLFDYVRGLAIESQSGSLFYLAPPLNRRQWGIYQIDVDSRRIAHRFKIQVKGPDAALQGLVVGRHGTGLKFYTIDELEGTPVRLEAQGDPRSTGFVQPGS